MSDRAREQVLKTYDVSRETTQALDAYVAQLHRWQTVKNLVGPSTLPRSGAAMSPTRCNS